MEGVVLVLGVIFGISYTLYNMMSESGDTKRFYEFCGGKEKLKYSDYGRSAGIAINTNEKILYIGRGKLNKKYPYTDVRSWGFVSNTQVTGVNTGLTNQVVSTKNTFEIDFRDVDNPRWNLKFSPEMSHRWTEILNQEIKEA